MEINYETIKCVGLNIGKNVKNTISQQIFNFKLIIIYNETILYTLENPD